MANSVKGEVPLALEDGRTFTLAMDFEMRVHVEDLTDRPFSEVAQRAARGFHGDVRAILWGSLQRHHSDLTMGDVTALIEQSGPELEQALTRAFEAAAPAANAEDGDGTRPSARHPRSKPSGATGARQG